jgi:hypothetical protein
MKECGRRLIRLFGSATTNVTRLLHCCRSTIAPFVTAQFHIDSESSAGKMQFVAVFID